jgi:zeaxanthin glucosyltransferase
MNTLEALTQGIPQVAIQVTNDQPDVAARIAVHQTGVVASLAKLTVSHLSSIVGEILNTSMHRENARKFQPTITKTNEVSRVSD